MRSRREECGFKNRIETIGGREHRHLETVECVDLIAKLDERSKGKITSQPFPDGFTANVAAHQETAGCNRPGGDDQRLADPDSLKVAVWFSHHDPGYPFPLAVVGLTLHRPDIGNHGDSIRLRPGNESLEHRQFSHSAAADIAQTTSEAVAEVPAQPLRGRDLSDAVVRGV